MAQDKLKDFARRLENTRQAHQGGDSARNEEASAIGLATRVVLELVVGILVALGVGWMLDKFFGTRPWLMLALLPFGFAAGVVNVMRLGRSRAAQDLMGGKPDATPARPPDDDED